MSDVLLEVKNLKKYFDTPNGKLHAVDDVSFAIERGKTLGIVGECHIDPADAHQRELDQLGSHGADPAVGQPCRPARNRVRVPGPDRLALQLDHPHVVGRGGTAQVKPPTAGGGRPQVDPRLDPFQVRVEPHPGGPVPRKKGRPAIDRDLRVNVEDAVDGKPFLFLLIIFLGRYSAAISFKIYFGISCSSEITL